MSAAQQQNLPRTELKLPMAELVNIDLSGGFGSESYALEELRAEFSSALMCNEFGAVLGDKLENCAAYLSSWSQAIKESPDELFKAIKDADSITEYVLSLESQKATQPPQHATEWDIEI